MTANVSHSAREGYGAEIDAYSDHIRGKDLAEGLAAFRGKREPRYR